ncbi:MAG: hypothetical protein ACREHC_00840 [Candidatus Levyibacteriota bacterium]
MDYKKGKQKEKSVKLWQLQDLLFEKIDAHTDAFIKRIEAMQQGKPEEAEYIEAMVLEPINMQIKYLAGKIIEILSNEKHERN